MKYQEISMRVIACILVGMMVIAFIGALYVPAMAETVADVPKAEGFGVTIDLTSLIDAVIAVVSCVLVKYLIPWLKAHTTAEKWNHLRAIVNTAVYAAEQIYGSGKGKEKLYYVEDYLRKRGITFNVENTQDRVRGMIEAAVREMSGFEFDQAEMAIEVEPKE